jgi:Trk-type K+ transport system membrane component
MFKFSVSSHFKVIWTLYYVILSFIIALVIMGIDGLSFIDGLVTSTSAITAAGLSAVPMGNLSAGSFVLTALLMMIGCPAFMMLLMSVYRIHCFQAIHKQVISQYRLDFARQSEHLSKRNLQIIRENYLIYESLIVLTFIILLYYLLWIAVGVLWIYATLNLMKQSTELAERGFYHIDYAVYVAISAFSNCGFTMTSDSLIGLANNPACYFIISILILAGNTALPIFLRGFINVILWLDTKYSLFSRKKNHFPVSTPYHYHFNTRTILIFILNNPRSLVTHLFTDLQTKILIVMVATLIGIQFMFFLFSVIFCKTLLHKYPLGQLLGIGYFQTLSTRAAGFAIMDLRELNEGLLLIYFIMMYISSFPFITTLHSSKVKPQEEGTEADPAVLLNIQQKKVVGDKEKSSPEGAEGENEMEVIEDEEAGNQAQEEVERELLTGLSRKKVTKRDDFVSVLTVMKDELYHKTMHKVEKVYPTDIDESHGKITRSSSASPHHVSAAGISLPVLQSHQQQHDQDSESSMIDVRNPLQGDPQSTTSLPTTEMIPVTTSMSSEGIKLRSIPKRKSYDALDLKEKDTAESPQEEEEEDHTTPAAIKQQFSKKFLFRHTFFLIFGLVLLSYSEDSLMKTGKYKVNLFYIAFEMISAYGSVGLSLGIPGQLYCLVGQMSGFGKFVIVLIMFLGKHRGLPNQNDEVINFSFNSFQYAYKNYDASAISIAEGKKSSKGV